jgi:HprK-related kinase A
MKLADINLSKVEALLHSDGLYIQTGRFVTRLKSGVHQLANDIVLLYGDTSFIADGFVDFEVELKVAGGLRKWFRPQVTFLFNGQSPFAPLPLAQSLPLLEWGLNWCVSSHYHQKLVIHAAVVEKKGRTIILPGQPGSGKSTLCAALVLQGGYRLLSDELTMLDLQTGDVFPNPRPISLKNQAIDIVAALSPATLFTDTVVDTIKGSVSLVKPPKSSFDEMQQTAKSGLVVFPKYNKDMQGFTLREVSKGKAFIELANHSFNYPVLCEHGFNALSRHLDDAECFDFEYNGDLQQAIQIMNELIVNE